MFIQFVQNLQRPVFALIETHESLESKKTDLSLPITNGNLRAVGHYEISPLAKAWTVNWLAFVSITYSTAPPRILLAP